MISSNTNEISAGFAKGFDRDELIQSVYLELKHLAANFLRREGPDHTLQPTALVHEAYIRLLEQESIVWQSREHFIGVAATMMRRVLVNHAVKKKRGKRGGGDLKLSFDEAIWSPKDCDWNLIALDEALTKLAESHPHESRVVELRFFGGLSIYETAGVLGVSHATIERNWQFARAWLLQELHG